MTQLTPVAMELLNTLIKAGMPYEKAIAFVSGETTSAANKVAYNQPKVDHSKVSKANSNSKAAKADSKKQPVAYGKIKTNDYFKVVNLNTNKVVAVGKAEKVDLKDKIVSTKGGKKFALENCVAINKATYNKISKSLKTSEAKAEKKSTSTRLAPVDYKLVYALNLKQLGKINEVEFQKAKDNADYATELYAKFKTEVKLDNATALKLFAENTSKEVKVQA